MAQTAKPAPDKKAPASKEAPAAKPAPAPAVPAPAPAPASAAASARKPCDELKDDISKKLDAKGVQGYTLDAVAAGDVKPDDKVIGSCDGGTKKITYKRG
jgi:propanediol dehydratase small subunit